MFKNLCKEILKYLIVFLLLIIVLFPLYYLIVVSLSTPDFFGKTRFKVDIFSPGNFQGLNTAEFRSAVSITVGVIFTLIFLRMTTLTLASFGLMKVNAITKKVMFWIFFFVSIIPEITTYLALKTIITDLGIFPSSLTISWTTNGIFSFFLMLYIYRAASQIWVTKEKIMIIDSLKWYQAFLYVYLPVLKMPYFLLVIFTTIHVWNEYLWPHVILSSLAVKNVTGWFLSLGDTGFGNITNIQAAGAVVSLLIPFSIYIVFSHWINKGISRNV